MPSRFWSTKPKRFARGHGFFAALFSVMLLTFGVAPASAQTVSLTDAFGSAWTLEQPQQDGHVYSRQLGPADHD